VHASPDLRGIRIAPAHSLQREGVGGKEDDHIVTLCLHELGQFIANSLGKSLDKERMGAPPVDDAPLDVRGQVTGGKKS